MEKDMVTIIRNQKDYEGIEVNTIDSLELISGKGNTNIMLVNCKGAIQAVESFEFPLKDAFAVHLCNEFLRSLNLGNNIEFITFKNYGTVIRSCMNLLTIKRIIEKAGYADSVTAWNVLEDMLGKLANNYGNVLTKHSDDLEPYVLESIVILQKEKAIA